MGWEWFNMLSTLKIGKQKLKKKTIMNTENNKIIAEFMDLKVITKEEYFKHPQHETLSLIEYSIVEYQRYHKDWNYLIEVVEKIENYNDSCTLVIIEGERCHVNSQNGFEVDSVGHTKIEATYNACVNFIKWYNEQKKV